MACLTALLAPPRAAASYIREPEDCDCQEPCATARQHAAKRMDAEMWGQGQAYRVAKENGWL